MCPTRMGLTPRKKRRQFPFPTAPFRRGLDQGRASACQYRSRAKKGQHLTYRPLMPDSEAY